MDPTDPDKVYISVVNAGELDIFNLSPNHPGFFYSHDGGTTWTENNSGLPDRYDNIIDGHSNTAAAASIVVLPQMPSYVVLGMADLYANIALFLNKTATTDGMVYYNTNSGAGNFNGVSNGLPTDLEQESELFGSLVRISSSIMMLSIMTGSNIGVWASHVSFTVDLSLANTLLNTRNKGVFFTDNGVWDERNGSLPYISSWTDNCSESDMTLKHKETYNASPVGIGKGPAGNYAMLGSLRSDEGNSSSNNTKIYATTNSAQSSWIKNWDDGLDSSPTMGYTEANAAFIAFNANNSSIFAAVYWLDDDDCDADQSDDGIYRMDVN